MFKITQTPAVVAQNRTKSFLRDVVECTLVGCAVGAVFYVSVLTLTLKLVTI